MGSFDKKLHFVGIGFPRCGTTWVAQCLHEHPDIFIPEVKETSFFSRPGHYKKGLEWYRRHFAHSGDKKFLGEFSTEYFYHSDIAEKLRAINPDVKILVCLRDPIQRCFSHYLYSRRTTLYGKSFSEVIATGHYIIECSHYYKYLKVFLESFSKENVYIAILEESYANPEDYIKKIYRFLGAREDVVIPSLQKKINSSAKYHYRFLFVHQVFMLRLKLREFLWWRWVVAIAKPLGIFWLLNKIYDWNVISEEQVPKQPALHPNDYQALHTLFKDDVAALRKYLGRDIAQWNV